MHASEATFDGTVDIGDDPIGNDLIDGDLISGDVISGDVINGDVINGDVEKPAGRSPPRGLNYVPSSIR